MNDTLSGGENLNKAETAEFILYHHWASPHSRRVRLHLAECGVEFTEKIEFPWERREEFLRLNPSGEVPVLLKTNGTALCGAYAISEYLETGRVGGLFGQTPTEAAEARRLISWFDEKFRVEVFDYIVHEKIIKTLMRKGSPNSDALKAGHGNLEIHLSYCEWLLNRRKLLAGDFVSLADLTAAAYLSCLDYIGCINWDNYPTVREWYVRIKSRPCFRGLLKDQMPGFPPVKHYSDLDF